MPARTEIIYTPEIFSLQPFGGISRYFVELTRGLRTIGQNPRVAAGFHSNEHLRELSGVTGMYLRFATVRAARQRRVANQMFCRWLLRRHPHAIAHLTYYGDVDYLRGRPFILTVYDMIHELFQDRFPELRNQADPSLRHKRRNCEQAIHIIAISEATKNDLVRLFGIDPAKVTAVPLGNSMPRLDGPLASSEDLSLHEGNKPRYLLFVGTRGGYKNFAMLLEAFAASATLRENLRLVCFGGGSFSEAEQKQIDELGVGMRVEHRGGDDAALARCYRGAIAYVCPSLCEGFGLPVLEAMSQGCPVICAQAGSLPEIAGEAAVYFDPQDDASIRAALETTISDSSCVNALRRAGLARARLFSWERCVRETLEIYRTFAI